MDAGRFRAIDLRAQLTFDLIRPRVGHDSRFLERQVPVLVQQRRNGVDAADGPPPEVVPLAVEREMNAQVGVRVLAREAGHFREPRTRHENAR